MRRKERPIYEVEIEKVLKDTGAPNKPFYAKVAEYKRYRLFGILLKKVSVKGDFPDPEDRDK